ncbi:MAG TPA: DJ-1 family protein, partial [Erysipelotrichaceae bacterium]|nr:DJ-1 family protein [Erysipelotrichaceae bacterium]
MLTSHGVRVMAEKLLKDTDLTGYDVLILPG